LDCVGLPVSTEEPVERKSSPPGDPLGRGVEDRVPPLPPVPVPAKEVEGVEEIEAGTPERVAGYDIEFPGLSVTLALAHWVAVDGGDGDALPLPPPDPLLVVDPVGVGL
jgi:hypothetical protein